MSGDDDKPNDKPKPPTKGQLVLRLLATLVLRKNERGDVVILTGSRGLLLNSAAGYNHVREEFGRRHQDVLGVAAVKAAILALPKDGIGPLTDEEREAILRRDHGKPPVWFAWTQHEEPTTDPWSTPHHHGEAATVPLAIAAAEAAARGEEPWRGLVVRLAQAYAAAAWRELKGKKPSFVPPRVRTWEERDAAWRARDDARWQAGAAQRAKWEAEYERAQAARDEESRHFHDDVRRRLDDLLSANVPRPADLLRLQVTPPITTENVQRAYRRRVVAERAHPDQGGSELAFRHLTEARDRLLRAVPA